MATKKKTAKAFTSKQAQMAVAAMGAHKLQKIAPKKKASTKLVPPGYFDDDEDD